MKQRGNTAIVLAAMAAGLALTPAPAEAYMGIGGSLSILGAAVGMLAAFAVSSFMVLTAPLRALKRWLAGTPGQPADDESKPEAAKAEAPAAEGTEQK